MKPEELKGMMKRVYDVCQIDQMCRADDKRLVYNIWIADLYGAPAKNVGAFKLSIDFRRFKKLSSPETIRRSRQKLQELGLCLPPEGVRKARQKRAKAIRTSPPVKPDPPVNKDPEITGQMEMF